MEKKPVYFYFDPISPYAWLAWHRCQPLIGENRLIPRPVLFAGLLGAHGTKGPAEIPAKRHYTFLDVQRWACVYGLTLRGPPAHPFNPLAPLRLSLIHI